MTTVESLPTNGDISADAEQESAEETTEAMDVSATDGTVKANGVESEEDVVKGANKMSGIFKLKVSGLPRFYPLGEFKKLVKDELGLALSYIRSPKRGNPWLHLTFASAEEQQRALKALHKYTWRKKTLTCNVLSSDSNGKRKPEDNASDDNDAKKAKLDMTIEERVLMVTIPMHNIPYDEQLKKKMDELKILLKRLADLMVRRNPALAGWAEQQREQNDGVPCKLEDILPSPVVDSYRNKCEFRIGLNPETQERTVGCRLEYFKEGKIGVGPADSFKHLPEQIREAVKLFQDYIRASDKGPFVVEKNEGYWRHLVVRMTGCGELMLVIVAHPQQLTPEELAALKADLKDFFLKREGRACNVTSLFFQQFTEKLVGVPLPPMERLFGKSYLEENILGVTFHLSPSSYFQVNTKGAEVLYTCIMDCVEPTEDTTVLDLCCGTGGIGLCIAKKCGQVFGIEYLEQNIEDAKLNADKNGITNCEFIAGRVEDILPGLEEKVTGKTIVPILDPPRADQKVLSQLRKMENVKKMVYVCSNHKAPIRNFLDLCCPAGKSNMVGHPFIPTRVIPVDVAPHTMHAQMVIVMERVDPSTLPKAKNPPIKSPPKKRGPSSRGNLSRGGIRGAVIRGRGGIPPRGMFRGRSMHAHTHAPPLLPARGGFMGMPRPPLRPPLRGPGPMRPRPRSMYEDNYNQGPAPSREYMVSGNPYRSSQRHGMDFSSDELTLSRYSDFRRDVEDAIDSSYSPRSMGGMRRSGGMDMRDNYPTAAEVAMMEREEMAYRAGLNRGLGASSYGPPHHPSSMGYPPFHPPMPSGRGKMGPSIRGVKRGGGRSIRRGRGGRR